MFGIIVGRDAAAVTRARVGGAIEDALSFVAEHLGRAALAAAPTIRWVSEEIRARAFAVDERVRAPFWLDAARIDALGALVAATVAYAAVLWIAARVDAVFPASQLPSSAFRALLRGLPFLARAAGSHECHAEKHQKTTLHGFPSRDQQSTSSGGVGILISRRRSKGVEAPAFAGEREGRGRGGSVEGGAPGRA